MLINLWLENRKTRSNPFGAIWSVVGMLKRFCAGSDGLVRIAGQTLILELDRVLRLHHHKPYG